MTTNTGIIYPPVNDSGSNGAGGGTGGNTGGGQNGDTLTCDCGGSWKNRIINGDFAVDLRGGDVVINDEKCAVERWFTLSNNAQVSVSRKQKSNVVKALTVDVLDMFDDGSCIVAFPFDGTADDLGQRFNGTWHGNERYVSAIFDKAAEFSTTSGVEIGTGVLSGFPFTVTAFIKKNSFPSRWSGLLSQYSHRAGERENRFILGFQSRDDRLAIFGSPSYSWRVFPFRFKLRTWYHVAVVFTETEAKLYVDTEYQGSVDITGLQFNTDLRTFISASHHNPNAYGFAGDVDQFRLFNRALTEHEIKQVYRESVDVNVAKAHSADIFGDGSCVGLYPFDMDVRDYAIGNDGIWKGGNERYKIGKILESAEFNGSNGVDVGQHDFSNVKSVSLWFNWDGRRGTNNWATLLSSKPHYRNDNIIVAVYKGKLYNYHNSQDTLISDQRIIKGKWYHLVVVENEGGNYDYYLNGELVGQNIPNNNVKNLDLQFIGCDHTNGSINEGFTGKIDQVRLFNKRLTPQEIKVLFDEPLNLASVRLFNGHTDLFGDSHGVAFWKFNHSLIDETGNFELTAIGDVSYVPSLFGFGVHLSNSHLVFPQGIVDLVRQQNPKFTFSVYVKVDNQLQDRTYICDLANVLRIYYDGAYGMVNIDYAPNAFNGDFTTVLRKSFIPNGTQWLIAVSVDGSDTFDVSVYDYDLERYYELYSSSGDLSSSYSDADTSECLIGSTNSQYQAPFEGVIDNVRFFDKAYSLMYLNSIAREVETSELDKYNHCVCKVNHIENHSDYEIVPFMYKFEGQHVYDLVVNKETVTVSFLFKASKTGKYSVVLQNRTDQKNVESIVKTFDYTLENDVKYVEVSFDLGLFSNPVMNNNQLSLVLIVAAFSTNRSTSQEGYIKSDVVCVDQSVAYNEDDEIAVTNVQLEKGDEATDFEIVPIEIQTLRCRRYFRISDKATYSLASDFYPMRDNPVIVKKGGFYIYDAELKS